MIFTIASGARPTPTKTALEYWMETSAALKKFKYPYDPHVFLNPYSETEHPHMYVFDQRIDMEVAATLEKITGSLLFTRLTLG